MFQKMWGFLVLRLNVRLYSWQAGNAGQMCRVGSMCCKTGIENKLSIVKVEPAVVSCN